MHSVAATAELSNEATRRKPALISANILFPPRKPQKRINQFSSEVGNFTSSDFSGKWYFAPWSHREIFDCLVITMLRRRPVQKSPYGTMEQSTWPVLNFALPSPGQGQFVSLAIRSGFECVHRWSQQHDLSARMDSFLRFTAL